MYGVIILLIFVALGLHLNPKTNDLSLSKQMRVLQLIFCISVAVFIPAVIHYTFGDVSKYDLFVFRPAIMYAIGIFFSIGLQLLVYGRFSTGGK